MFNHNPEERIKRLEEEVMWMQRDINHLITIIESLQKPVEIHTHYIKITENVTCTACNE